MRGMSSGLLGGVEEGVVGVVGGGGLEESEGGADEFVEDGEEDGHGGFAVGAEALGEGLGARVVAHGGESREVELVAEDGSGVADTGGFAHGGAALALAWDDAEPGGDGAGVFEVARDLGGEEAGGLLAAAGNGLQAGDVGGEFGAGGEGSGEGLFEAGEFGGQPAQGTLEALAQRGCGGAVSRRRCSAWSWASRSAWRRNNSRSRACAGGSGCQRSRGWVAAKRAMSCASARSVLLRRPRLRAKSRTRRGLSTAT